MVRTVVHALLISPVVQLRLLEAINKVFGRFPFELACRALEFLHDVTEEALRSDFGDVLLDVYVGANTVESLHRAAVEEILKSSFSSLKATVRRTCREVFFLQHIAVPSIDVLLHPLPNHST